LAHITAAPPTPWQFLIYRLFSITGLVPIGGFLVVHLVTNASTLSGPAAFQNNVNLIHGLGPILPVVEWVFIFAPLIFHAVIGVLIISGAVVNVGSYPYSLHAPARDSDHRSLFYSLACHAYARLWKAARTGSF
jgi:succinate dehydrogenase/fumarate reductase cytochrome b subunit